jgi:sterol desaturase/sphingolipid hydroxylase (fatty acid hydroxylase superfamily)
VVIQDLLQFVGQKFVHSFLSLGSSFSAASLLSALCIAIAVTVLRRPLQKRDVKLGVMFRAVFPPWLYRHPSFKADLLFLVFNVFIFGLLFGWALLSMEFISRATNDVLRELSGTKPENAAGLSGRLLMTVALFLVYELGYWAYHYLSHKIPILWEFHKVHHTAEVLSPMTNFRMHPVDSLAFHNFMAVFTGVASGVASYVLAIEPGSIIVLDNTNIILLAFVFVTVHLQHSHFWIAATGPLGHTLMSPAHHQFHHSTNPKHFDKNFGSCLAVWDWLFGTLVVPLSERERLKFGIRDGVEADHTVVGGLITPFLKAVALFNRNRPSSRVTG